MKKSTIVAAVAMLAISSATIWGAVRVSADTQSTHTAINTLTGTPYGSPYSGATGGKAGDR